MYLHLRIPLSSYQATFEVYKIITIPLLINNNQSTNMYDVQIKDFLSTENKQKLLYRIDT